MPFDKRQDYGTVHGESNARYAQNHKYYDANYFEVTEDGDPIPNGDHPVQAVEPAMEVPESIPETIPGSEVALEDLPWQQVKARVIAAGGVWTNKIEGIAFLQGI